VVRPFRLAAVACLSPLPWDANHSTNTLRFAAALMASPAPTILKRDDNTPWTWTREEAFAFIETASGNGRVCEDIGGG
jgi:hypothetical protein